MTLASILFLQTDPIEFSAGDMNIYRYCGNNPLNDTDPMGMAVGDWWDPSTYISSAFWQGASDPIAWQQSAAATVDGLETLGGLAPWQGSFDICPGDEYNQNISMDLGGIGDFGIAGALASFLGLGGAAAEESSSVPFAFWSGEGSQAAATSWAEANGGLTLGMTNVGTDLEATTAGMDWTEAQPLWNSASQAFAASASGEVNVFIGTGASESGIFMQTELPTLLNNPQVTNIIYNF